MNRKGIIFVISAPSGTGKTTLCKKLLELCPAIKLSISFTTRKPRAGEEHGRDYFFVDENTFKEMVTRGDFLEWALVHGNFYGTSLIKTKELLEKGFDLLFDIDVQGGKSVKQQYPEAVLIFILPPSLKSLQERLAGRMTDSEDEIIRRLRKAKEEIVEYRNYDYVIFNNRVDEALAQLKAIITSERLKVSRANHNFINENFLT
ncbi:MAG: guanylate kinase [Thermodesulfovibrionales bacterium]|nr:guanylate kinase [Thermodesulfovibrionales bacterium]